MENFRKIVSHLISNPAVIPGFSRQFQAGEGGRAVLARDLNAAFLLTLSEGSLSRQALGYLSEMAKDPEWGEAAGFYLQALDRIEAEIGARMASDPVFKGKVRELAGYLKGAPGMERPETLEKMRMVFFPEGEKLPENREEAVRELRDRRAVNISALNPDPVTSPHRQILFTANVLLTVPVEENPDHLLPGPWIREGLEKASQEDQAFWYDHPIPIGVSNERNEAVYGLRGLEEAILFEIRRGNVPSNAKVPVLLSVSATHEGLQAIARPYLKEEIAKAGRVPHLDLYAVTERDALDLLNEVLLPSVHRYLPGRETGPMKQVFGVDGEYGRHYSFLKAVSALWQSLLDNRIRATFKIDLDQVFPQDILVSETGRSAFEHLLDPLWGAEGTDAEGRPVRLSMLAGALVNEADIGNGLFSPDVKWPPIIPESDRWIFDSSLPQALSTEAEMMTRYSGGRLDGMKTCLQRIHVTGGTTGILVDDLRRYRPFTPTWIGRAEDQAYLLSVLHTHDGPALRYAHASGLFMRHDKKAFAADAMEAALVGKMVGDYVRIMVLTAYARALPWDISDIKSVTDPFTGCFVSGIPVTVSALRLALKAATLFAKDSGSSSRTGIELVRMGCARLGAAGQSFSDVDKVRDRYMQEKAGWDLYYDTLDTVEKNLENGDPFAEKVRQRARMLMDGWRI